MMMYGYVYGYLCLMWGKWKPTKPLTSTRFTEQVTGCLDSSL